ncbi:MAG: J domain-containing protein [Planctomycetota bacterium]|nr:J domain-containing protein [Planctomycetota bacterium]
MEEDYYKTLSVGRDASAADIQKAYRKLARKYHPDVNPDDATAKRKFQEIQKAYEVLNDAEKREMYDRYGSSFESMGAGGPGGGTWRTHSTGTGGQTEVDFSQFFGGGVQGGFEGGFGDIFRQFGGGGGGGARRSRQRPRKGADLKHQLDIPFNTTVTGGEARINVKRPDGKVEAIAVKIPAGIEDGKTIRLRGQGEPSPNGGPAGDLLITVKAAPHPYFRRRGSNLEVNVPVTLAEAGLGGKIDVPTPKGVITLTVPPGTSSGKRLRVKGHGVQLQASPGDLYAEIQIVLPSEIDAESENLIRQLDAKQQLKPRADLRW